MQAVTSNISGGDLEAEAQFVNDIEQKLEKSHDVDALARFQRERALKVEGNIDAYMQWLYNKYISIVMGVRLSREDHLRGPHWVTGSTRKAGSHASNRHRR